MKTLLVVLVIAVAGFVASVDGQTASSTLAPAPAVSAPPPATAPQKKVRSHPQKDQVPVASQAPVTSQKPVESAVTPGPNHGRRDGQARSKPAQPPPAVNFADAIKRQHRDRHDRDWWKKHFITIVFVNRLGYYYWDAGYWFPAYGYDPGYEAFDYNGPIYTYGNLLPDQVILNVQGALKDLGYYAGPLNGSLGSATRAAISAFQEDNGLDITGSVDAPTVEALGLY